MSLKFDLADGWEILAFGISWVTIDFEVVRVLLLLRIVMAELAGGF